MRTIPCRAFSPASGGTSKPEQYQLPASPAPRKTILPDSWSEYPDSRLPPEHTGTPKATAFHQTECNIHSAPRRKSVPPHTAKQKPLLPLSRAEDTILRTTSLPREGRRPEATVFPRPQESERQTPPAEEMQAAAVQQASFFFFPFSPRRRRFSCDLSSQGYDSTL